MAVMNCKMCGTPLFVTDGMRTRECTNCKTAQTVPQTITLDIIEQINLANEHRQKGDFEAAEKIYDALLDRQQDADFFWGRALCRYGVIYIDNPTTGRKIPTCHRPLFRSILADDDYIRATDLATQEQFEVMSEEGRIIAAIQKRQLQQGNAAFAEPRMLSDGSERETEETPEDAAQAAVKESAVLLPEVLGQRKIVDPEMEEADRILARGILDTRALNNLANRYEKLAAVRPKPGDDKEVRQALEERRKECLEKAKECRYRSATMIMEANGNAESMLNAADAFANLEFYKDSKNCMINCMDRSLDKARKISDKLSSASAADRRILSELSIRYKELMDEDTDVKGIPEETRKMINSRRREFSIRANECDYIIALIDMENSKDPEVLATAEETFRNLGKFRDASKRMDEAHKKSMAAAYDRAEYAMKWAYEPEQFEEAAALFEELGDYRDCELQASICRKKAVRKEMKHISNRKWHVIVAAVIVTIILIVALLVWIQPQLPVWVGVFLGIGYLWKRILEIL